MIRFCLGVLVAVALAGCEAPRMQRAPVSAPVSVQPDTGRLPPRQAAANFVAVAGAMEPKIEQECRARTRGQRSCDYRIMIDDRPTRSPNAFQTVDKAGNPVIAFNLALIAEARNPDELAFVMGHEAAHHILGHLSSKSRDASAGALIMGVLAAASGADPDMISQAQNMGANVGSRAYSKNYELAADRLGAVITWNAGYDPMRGAQFFTRLADPGDTFLGSHPANGERLEVVRRTVEQLRSGAI
ncbi:M48 family metallopeptidase [Paenirhodobacter sp.]|uniref:M48 family metallopeptidase n=1 Tax=Paenirhodobacter sp. TaxID=1965326 RepID=UPI003B3F8F97